ncbi:RHS repeat-associated core domain-containing protein [Pseudomonas sp. FGI182]|uniref:RHS repeat-associated core domain-containing protein n=1 Tax=Pseudomonas sp. FGI182 TaxID=1259844 RepID=UPI0009E053AD|nr:RHS repeat-associated core domain-containing protein [Pseudomonas sp. FGI182]
MRLFYCNDILSHIAYTFTNESIFRHGRYNLSLKDQQNTQWLLSTDSFNTPFLTNAPNQGISYRYSAFGFSAPSNNEWGFKGERKDPISNGYLLGNGRRLYNSTIMRFASPDPLSPLSKGGLNYYAFTLNDPINNSDPTGLFTQPILRFFAKLNPKKTYRGDILWQYDGITAFADKRRTDGNLDTIYILSHGEAGVLTGNEFNHSALDIFVRLKQKGIEMRGRQTHFLACYSATPESYGGYSVADEMAKLTGAQSSGYDGRVSVVDEIDKSGKILSHRLSNPLINFIGLGTATKVRRGNIRNPHKTENTGPGGRHW